MVHIAPTMIASVALSALRYASAFQPASPTFARRASSILRASDDDYADFSSKVSIYYTLYCLKYNCIAIAVLLRRYLIELQIFTNHIHITMYQ